MDNLPITVSTHAPGELLSRLGRFRLKDAARRRDIAIAEAHRRYAEEVRAILGPQDDAATSALRRGLRANCHSWCWWRDTARRAVAPALANPYGHALPRSALADLRALARRIRRG